MGRTVLTIIGVLLAIWIVFMFVGMLVAALKFLLWIGFLAVIAAVVVMLISKLSKST